MLYLIAFFSSLLATASFPNLLEKGVNVHTAGIIFVAYVPVIWATLKAAKAKEKFILPYLSASAFYVLSLYWLKNVAPMGPFAPVGWFILSFYLAIWFALPLWVSVYLYEKKGLEIYLSMPALLTAGEYIREWMFTGFPLLTPAQALHSSEFLDGAVKAAGSHGANFIIYAVNSWAALLLSGKKPDIRKTAVITSFSAALILIAFCLAGYLKPKAESVEIKAAILQPNIDQNVEWDRRYVDETMLVFMNLIDEAKKSNPDVYVWPETGFPGIFSREMEAAKLIAARSGAVSIIGSDDIRRKNGEILYYNSAFSLDDKGYIEGSYSKYHLVPFGEYIPLAGVFPFVKKVVQRYGYSGFTRGTSLQPVKAGDYKAGIMICYDALFPEIARAFALKGASYLTHLSYETWYGNTPASAQIFQNTALRAKETGLPIVRTVASGISGFVDGYGKIRVCAGLFEKKACVSTILPRDSAKKTLYVLLGDWFPLLLLCLCGFFMVWRK